MISEWSESVPVRIKPVDQEEYTQNVILKICSAGSSTRPSQCPPLQVELNSESDLFFFYSLKLTESDYHFLKSDQRLLVEFSQFPSMVEELVRSKMTLVFTLDVAGDATLSFVEANQFRELTYLALKLRKGTDESIKSYLAARLLTYKTNTSNLENEVSCLRAELKRVRDEKDCTYADLGKARAESGSAAALIESQFEQRIARLKEEHAREIRDMHLSTSNDRSNETRRLYDEVMERDSRTRELEKRLEESRITLVSVENSFHTSQKRVASLERGVDMSRDQTRRLETENRELANLNFSLEKKVANLTVELATKEAQIQSSSQLADRSTGHCRELEMTLTTSRQSQAHFTERIAELESEVAGKDLIVSKLQVKNKNLKVSCKEVQQALLQQEQVVIGLQRDLAEQRGKFEIAGAEKESQKNRVRHLEDELARLRGHEQSHAQTISLLNRKLGERDTQIYSKVNFLPHSTSTSSIADTSGLASMTTPALPHMVVPEYINRSAFLNSSGVGDDKAVPERAATPSLSRIMTGKVKFIPRTGTTPLIK